MTVYKFTSIDRVLEFIKPLLVEGRYSVSIKTVYEEYPFEVTVEEIKENDIVVQKGVVKLSEKSMEILKAKKELKEENKELKELVEKYRQAVDKCLHITFMGGDCEVNTIGEYATLVDGYLTDLGGLAKWKN